MTALICAKCGTGNDIEDEDPAFPFDWDLGWCYKCSTGEDGEEERLVRLLREIEEDLEDLQKQNKRLDHALDLVWVAVADCQRGGDISDALAAIEKVFDWLVETA